MDWIIFSTLLYFMTPFCEAGKIFRFPNTDDREIGTGAKLKTNIRKEQKDLTICVEFYVTLIRYFDIFSSITEDGYNVAIFFPTNLNTIEVAFKNNWYIIYTEIAPYNWNGFCLSYRYSDHKVTVAYNGNILLEKQDGLILSDRKLPANTFESLYIGKKSASNTLAGDVARFNAWGKPMRNDQLKLLTQCNGVIDKSHIPPPDLVEWETSSWEIIGNPNTEVEVASYSCDIMEKNQYLYLMPRGHPFYEASAICSSLGGIMPVPKNKNDQIAIRDYAIKESQNPRIEESCAYLWNPVRQDEFNETIWVVQGTEEKPVYLDWVPGQPNGGIGQACTGFGLTKFEDERVYDLDCNQIVTYCYVCQFDEIIFYNIRGLCERMMEVLDVRYVIPKLSKYEENGIFWQGFSKTRILYDKVNKTWIITSMFDKVPIIKLADQVTYPVGFRKWDIEPNICGDDKSERYIFLNSCLDTEFACLSGSCIDIQNRCDGENNCEDQSDESNCNTLFWERGKRDSYSKKLPPSNPDGSKIPVTVTSTILDILEIKELDGKFTVKVNFEIFWYDDRLKLQNLKSDKNMNTLNEEEIDLIWVPQIVFVNNRESRRLALDEKAVLTVLRKAEGFPTDVTFAGTDEVFDGAENPIVYSRTYKADFECYFNLRAFPFDTQECLMELGIPAQYERMVKLVGKDILFQGSTKLAQFEVEKWSLTNAADNLIQFSVIIRRMYLYHVLTVYIPSACLLAITLFTTYIDGDHFEASIMVHLTTMLVMYTLFQAISVSMPQTAYAKLLDIWLFFGLLLPFLAFALEILDEIFSKMDQSDKDRQPSLSSVKVNPIGANMDSHNKHKGRPRSAYTGSRKLKLVKFLSRTVLPILTLIFILGYMFYCMHSYYYPTMTAPQD